MKKIAYIIILFGCVCFLVACTSKVKIENEIQPSIKDEIDNELSSEKGYLDTEETFEKTNSVLLDKSVSTIQLTDDDSYVLLGINDSIYSFVRESGGDSCDYVQYDTVKRDWNVIGTIENYYDCFLQEIWGNTCVVGTGYWVDDGIHYQVQIFGADGVKETVVTGISSGFPTGQVIDNYLIFNISIPKGNDTYESAIQVVNLETKEISTVFDETYTMKECSYYEGAFAMELGGWSKGFCFERVEMECEDMLDKLSGHCTVYYCNLEDLGISKLFDFSRKPFFIKGNTDCIITSAYALDSENTGKITCLEGNQYKSYLIPGIMPGEDLNDSIQIEKDIYLICNGRKTMFYNINKKQYYEVANRKLLNGTRDNIIWFKEDGCIFSCVQEEKKLIVYRYKLEWS